MKNVIYSVVLIGIMAFTGIGCDKDTPNMDSEDIDTLDYRYINTTSLVNCMLINDIGLKRDSFIISTDSELKENFTEDICTDVIPPIDFQDSVIIGYTTKIGGSGKNNERNVEYDRSKNSLIYSITAFTNDTSLLYTELNWVAVPKYNFDSITYKLKMVKE